MDSSTLPTGIIRWETPPPAGRGPGPSKKREAFVAELMRRPGEWAVWADALKSASGVTTNKKLFPGTEWVARRQPDRTWRIYARWIGIDGERD